MHALRNLHAALRPGGTLVDTEPDFAAPPVESNGAVLGRLDMREWRRTADAVDAIVAESVPGLFEIAAERWLSVPETFADGASCLEAVAVWDGTRVPTALERRLRTLRSPVSVVHDVRLRLLVAVSRDQFGRRAPPSSG